MYFDSFQAFLMMGKHGAYVWSAFAISIISIVVIQFYARWRHQRLQKLLILYKKELS